MVHQIAVDGLVALRTEPAETPQAEHDRDRQCGAANAAQGSRFPIRVS